MRELVALAKAKPGQILYASSGAGTSTHLAMEMFRSLAKIDLMHVPYKGGTPEALGDYLKIEIARWTRVIKEQGITSD